MKPVHVKSRFVVVITVLVAACGAGTSSRPESNRAPLTAVALPDLSNAAPPVQSQIRAQHAALTATIAKSDASPDALGDAYGQMGKLFMAADYLEAAAGCFENARTLAPSEMRWPYYLGHVFRLKTDPGRAAAAFEQALAVKADYVPALLWLAEMRLAMNDTQAAEMALLKARSLEPRAGAVLYGLGRVALARQDYSHAVTYLEDALAVAPSATRIHYSLATAYGALGNRANAETHLRKRGDGDLTPNDALLSELESLLQNASAYEVRGSVAMGEKRWADAVAALRKAAELAPDNATTRLNLGTSLYMTEDAAGALQEFQTAVRLSPGLAKAHFAIGVLMQASGRDGEAIEAFSKAVQAQPDADEMRLSLADALRRTGRDRESLTHYAQIVERDPSASQAVFGHAMALVRLRQYVAGRDRLSAGMKTFPDQPGFAHALARVLAAAPDDRVRNGARALNLVETITRSETSVPLAETMAMSLAEVGRFDEALRWQRRAIEMAKTARRPDLAARLTENLELYEQHRPCRTPWADDDPVFHPKPAQ